MIVSPTLPLMHPKCLILPLCIRIIVIALTSFGLHMFVVNVEEQHLQCMHDQGCLHTVECPIRGRAGLNIDKWLFERWGEEVDVDHVLVATLP